MPIYNTKVLHIHIPKTGGTAITRTLDNLGVQVLYYDKGSLKRYGDVPPQHMTIQYTQKNLKMYKFKCFAIIRNPWHRTVSEYVWRKRTNRWEPLNDWVDFMLNVKNHPKYDNHFLQQHHFINDQVKLFKYEDWDDAIGYISKHLRIKFQTNKKYQRRFKYTPPDIDILSKDTRKAWESYYSKDLKIYNSL